MPLGGRPLVPLPKRRVARSFWSTATTKCLSLTTASTRGGLAPAAKTAGPRSWKRTGSVTSWVRTTVPAGRVTLAAGGRERRSSTSAVAAWAPWRR